jgi:hypothetical protein
MQAQDIREEAKRLIEKLPSSSTWDDVMHEIYMRQTIDRGLADSHQGRVTEVKDVRKRFGLSE